MTLLIRIIRHLVSPGWIVRKYFSVQAMDSIKAAISSSEKKHCGEVRFAVEHALHVPDLLSNTSARDRALEVFSLLRIWDTECNNGVLIYLLLADKSVEIIADRGINKIVGSQEWGRICSDIKSQFKKNAFPQGVLHGIEQITVHLSKHFPYSSLDTNELDDSPMIL